MQTAKYLCLIAALALLSNHAFADRCSVDTINSDKFLFELQVDSEGQGLMLMAIEIPHSYDCLMANELTGIIEQPMQCEESLINDILFRTMDFFIISSKCSISYNITTDHLVIETSSIMERIAEENNGFQEIRFNKWNLTDSDPEIENTLKVVLPEGSEIVSYFPQQNSTSTVDSIFWNEAPSEPISIKYTLPTPIEQNPLVVGGIVFSILALGGIIAGIIVYLGRTRKKIGELSKKEELLNKKLENLRLSYLKRRIDEETYKNLAEELTLKLTDVKVEKKSLIKKK